jgi:threonine aldolase
MAALAEANRGHAMPYGADPWTARAVAAVRAVFEAPQAEVLLVPTGIAANALALAALVPPWGRVFCTDIAHIERDETGALGAASGGAEPALVPSVHGRMSPDALAARLGVEPAARRGAVSITQATEAGTLYRPEEVAALAQVARAHALPVHMDGARWSNAAAALGCTPADMTWRAGVDVLSLGATKAGLVGAEAVVFFEPAHAAQARLRRSRMGLCLSKQRYMAAQVAAWLEDGLWREIAGAANAAGARLAAGLAAHPDIALDHPAEANIVFARFPRALHRRLHAAGAVYYLSDMPEPDCATGDPAAALGARFVCDWTADAARIDALLAAIDA